MSQRGWPVRRRGDSQRASRSFQAVEHRLEYVATVNGVDFYNDSKATNVDATAKAIAAFHSGIHLIMGGKDKGSPLHDTRRSAARTRAGGLHHRVGSGKIESQLRGVVPILSCETLEKAVTAGGRCRASRRRGAAGAGVLEL